MAKARDEMVSDLVIELRKVLLENYEPVTDPTKADFHLSTKEIYDKLQRVIPGKKNFKPSDVAAWLHASGFKFRDYGFLQFEWLLKIKEDSQGGQ